MKNIILLVLLLIPFNAFATQISYPTTYSPQGQVTSTNLNGNFAAASAIVNGKLDNTNADTTNGYRFYKTVAVLPSAGSQGAVYFLTTDNSLNFDTGTSFSKSVSVIAPSANQVPVYNGSIWVPTNTANLGFASGMIMLWSGTIATIPSGWELSDGTCAITCPDLRNLFVVGANADSGGAAKSTITGSAAQSGGSTTISLTQIPAHTHDILTSTTAGGATTYVRVGVAAAQGVTQVSSSAGGGLPYTQPFYALAYIIKD